MSVLLCSCEKPSITLQKEKFIYTCATCSNLYLLPLAAPNKYVYVSCLSGGRMARVTSHSNFTCDVCKETFKIAGMYQITKNITIWRADPVDKKVTTILDLKAENKKLKAELEGKKKAEKEIQKTENSKQEKEEMQMTIDSLTSEIGRLKIVNKDLLQEAEIRDSALYEEQFDKLLTEEKLSAVEKKLENMEEYTKKLETGNIEMLKGTLKASKKAHELEIRLAQSEAEVEAYKNIEREKKVDYLMGHLKK